MIDILYSFWLAQGWTDTQGQNNKFMIKKYIKIALFIRLSGNNLYISFLNDNCFLFIIIFLRALDLAVSFILAWTFIMCS